MQTALKWRMTYQLRSGRIFVRPLLVATFFAVFITWSSPVFAHLTVDNSGSLLAQFEAAQTAEKLAPVGALTLRSEASFSGPTENGLTSPIPNEFGGPLDFLQPAKAETALVGISYLVAVSATAAAAAAWLLRRTNRQHLGWIAAVPAPNRP